VLHDRRVVVLGSGPAGATAALVLVQSGIDVTLIEAGPARAARGLTAQVAGLTVARSHRRLQVRGEGVSVTGDPGSTLFEDLAPGGLTNHWSGAVPRFSSDDFADARRAGEAYTWPLEYDDLAPWYDRIEPMLQIAGGNVDVRQLPAGKVRKAWRLQDRWAPVIEQARQAGQGLVPMPYAYGASTTLTLSGTVFNAFVRLVKPLYRSGRLTVRFDARATRLEWSGEARRVKAVVFRDAGTGVDHRITCRAVVLAAGAVNTAKILLQSTDADFPEGLGNTHGVLGRYLTDHPLAKVEIDLARPMPFHPPAYLTRPPLDRTPPLFAAACAQWGGVKMIARSVLTGRPGRLPWCGFNVFGTMAPEVGNYVSLDPTRSSSDGTVGIAFHLRHPPQSAQSLLAARDQLIGLLESGRTRPRMRLWLIDPVGTSVHYAGTCRMHTSPQFGMLDRWGRLHAVRNVAVADSAAFTTHPEKNPVLTAMALSARTSQRLADDLRTGAI
jgi:choline dehydrogenase-like flavoprotein